MSLATIRAERRVRLVTRVILLAGALAAVAIWIANASPSPTTVDLERSKQYLHDMEVYGGRANVLAEDFRDWFAGLWRGRNLACTVAVLTVLVALVYRFFATPLPEDGGGTPPKVGGPP